MELGRSTPPTEGRVTNRGFRRRLTIIGAISGPVRGAPQRLHGGMELDLLSRFHRPDQLLGS